jgi:hypothetical protein
VLIERQRTGEHQAMEARRRTGSPVEGAGFAERESEGDGPALFAQQRRVIADRQDRCQIGGRGQRHVDLSGASRLVPAFEHARGEV